MPSRINSPSSQGEAGAEDEVIKEEGEFQVTINLMKVRDKRTKMIISRVPDNRTRIKTYSLKEVEGEDQMTNQSYDAITGKCLGTMNLNVRRSKQINSQTEHMSQIMKDKPEMVCFSHARRPKNNIKISSWWIVDATTT
jgi:hypothetical protein